MARVCPNCGGTDIDVDDSRGETYCSSCGVVLEESVMVANVGFAESSGGIVRAMGQFVSAATGKMGSSSSGGREQLLQRGYTNIQRLADFLKINSFIVESAQRVMLLATQRNFTIGRCSHHVACACLYAVCRRENHPLMLIDFSDVLKVPVRVLGQIFTKLLRVLHLHVPSIDPSLFMDRYARELDYVGDQAQTVAATGVRLVQAMSRDWICTGRRPTGLCGAALLIASRYHGFKVDAADVSSVTRISNYTVNKRLEEWKLTAVANLAISEFETTDLTKLPILSGPPCFETAKRKLLALTNGKPSRKRKRLMHSSVKAIRDDDEDDCISTAAATPVDERCNFARRSKLAGTIAIEDARLCADEVDENDLERIAAKMVGAIRQTLDDTGENQEDLLQDLLAGVRDSSVIGSDSLVLIDPPATVEEEEDDFDFTLFPLLAAQNTVIEASESTVQTPTTPQAIQKWPASTSPYGDEEGLSDVSDSEVDGYILDAVERRAKGMIWDQLTGSIMPRLERRWNDRKKAAQVARAKLVGDADEIAIKKSRRLKDSPQSFVEAASPAESVRIALLQSSRFIGKKVNGDVLLSLFDGWTQETETS